MMGFAVALPILRLIFHIHVLWIPAVHAGMTVIVFWRFGFGFGFRFYIVISSQCKKLQKHRHPGRDCRDPVAMDGNVRLHKSNFRTVGWVEQRETHHAIAQGSVSLSLYPSYG
jgi:hypothetical protein